MPNVHASIGQFIVRGVLPQVTPDDSVANAARVMKERGSDCVVVVESERVVGIFTERDFLERVAVPARDPRTVRVRAVMTPDPDTLQEDDNVRYAINRMAVGGYRNVAVVDSAGRPVAVLSVRDVIRHLNEILEEALDIDPPEMLAQVAAWNDVGGG